MKRDDLRLDKAPEKLFRQEFRLKAKTIKRLRHACIERNQKPGEVLDDLINKYLPKIRTEEEG